MLIEISKRERRYQLTCRRADGSFTSADVGPQLPFHDLAHYVVETRMGLRGGFFGSVASGYDLPALGDANVITTLGPEATIAEILARALAALATGAATPEQLSDLVRTETQQLRVAPIEHLTAPLGEAWLAQLRSLLAQLAGLSSGATLRLIFP